MNKKRVLGIILSIILVLGLTPAVCMTARADDTPVLWVGGTTEVPLYIITEGLIYRMYDPNSPSGEHNWTSDEAEVAMLIEAGWINEGICWRIV